MGSFIELKKVSVLREDTKILDDVNLNIDSNENIAIIGPNGSGKSTFIKLITGKIYPSYTSDYTICRLFGRTHWNVFDMRSMLGIVTNELEYAFHNEITGLETVLSGFFSSVGIAKNFVLTKKMIQTANDIIELLDVAFLKYRKFKTMSSGETRRFLIARALVNAPKVLILDEPSNGLDITSFIKFRNTIRRIVASGTKIVLVTHMISDVIPEINRFIFFKNGKIFADGKRSEIFNSATLSSLFNVAIHLNENNGLCEISVA
jgi:iron complex transport system ATP-binding protein